MVVGGKQNIHALVCEECGEKYYI
ncbi:YgiT-type zinc finger protein [Tepidanaerobacter sp. GT38]|nr:YgiT-type zinc finger protein [Tepidanaerobacter sp. GT38]